MSQMKSACIIKDILECGQIACNGTESMIPDIEGHSNSHPLGLI